MGAGELPKDLLRAKNRFQAWRRRRAKGRIPHFLWELAVQLAARHGLSRTATALGLHCHRLQKQVEAGQPPSAPAAFVELPPPALVGKHCLFEWSNRAGASLRVQLTGCDASDLEAVARGLRGVG